MIIERINDHLKDDIAQMHALLDEGLHSEVPLINELARYTFQAGGKGIRARILLLLVQALQGKNTQVAPLLAATVECIHTATLLHDDIVDDSDMRRGMPSANITFGSAASLLVGDFLYALSFQYMIKTNSFDVLRILAAATKQIAEGEVYQLVHGFSPQMTQTHYFTVIEKKTATLFHASAVLAATTQHVDSAVHDACATFGRQLGMAFQLVDDALDYVVCDSELGKKQGDDWVAGKITLPFIKAYANASVADRKRLSDLYANCGRDTFSAAKSLIEQLGGVADTVAVARKAQDEAQQALLLLSHSTARDLLWELCDFVCERTH